jgi:hypothetical protein
VSWPLSVETTCCQALLEEATVFWGVLKDKKQRAESKKNNGPIILNWFLILKEFIIRFLLFDNQR